MSQFESYAAILKEELVLASGCTEPIALAYLTSIARDHLKEEANKITVYCSPNIVKNVKSVTIPNTRGMRGIKAAIIAGLVAGNSDKKMEVIAEVSEAQQDQIQAMMNKNLVEVICLHDEPNLSIKIEMCGVNHTVRAELMHTHTNITLIEKDGLVLFENRCDSTDFNSVLIDRSCLNVADIIRVANECDLSSVQALLEAQITSNMKIAKEGLAQCYGAQVGQTLMQNESDIFTRCMAYAAAASDARMSGCKYPVMTNSGSGNQGITCSIPVIVYADEKNVPHEKLLRALLISNLIAIHIKTGIGRLSAYCGVVCAATGSFAAIAYLDNKETSTIEQLITNSLATTSGMICDGAKESCASKISTALFSAMLGYKMAANQRCFGPDCGIVQENVEKTIQVVGTLGKVGMKKTDEVVLDIMTK